MKDLDRTQRVIDRGALVKKFCNSKPCDNIDIKGWYYRVTFGEGAFYNYNRISFREFRVIV